MMYKVGQLVKLYKIAQPCKIMNVRSRGYWKGYLVADSNHSTQPGCTIPCLDIKEKDIDHEKTKLLEVKK